MWTRDPPPVRGNKFKATVRGYGSEVAVKALVKAEDRPGLWLQDVPEPRIEPDEVLIKVLRTGLCGTDLHIQNWDAWAQRNVPVPMVTGHEFCGEVVEAGAVV